MADPYIEYYVRQSKGQSFHQEGFGFINMDTYSGPYAQQGCGLGSLLSGFFSRLIPFGKSMLPVIGKAAWESGKEAVKEIASGQDGPTVLRKRGREAAANIIRGVADKMAGGKRRKMSGKGRVQNKLTPRRNSIHLIPFKHRKIRGRPTIMD